MCITRETGQSVRFPLGRRPSLETNGKKTPASSSILKYDGVNSRRPSPAFDTAPRVRVARQPFPPSSHSPFNLHAIPSFSPSVAFSTTPTAWPRQLYGWLHAGYTPLSRNCKGNRRWDRWRNTEGGVRARRRSAVEKKEGGKGRKMEGGGWRILGKMDGPHDRAVETLRGATSH